jgi:vanillate O-demethylase ferredoxin subunit
LCSSPADTTQYLIGVQLEADGRGGSRYMHSLRVGDALEALLPRNDFPLYPDADHSLLIAGGVGITPLLSMMHTLLAGGRSFEVHYSARHSDDLAFTNSIDRLAGRNAHYYSSDGPAASKLHLRRLFDNAAPNTHFYVCGPVRMIREVIELGTRFAWPGSQIHFESFGAGAQVGEKPVRVTLARRNRTVVVPTHLSILDALLRAGIDVPHDCKRGECSLCRTRVLDGQPEHRDLCLDADERDESMRVCVSRAHNGHLTLDL